MSQPVIAAWSKLVKETGVKIDASKCLKVTWFL